MHDRQNFWKTNFSIKKKKKKKKRKNRPKIRIFEFIGKFRYYFLNLIYKERLYILLYCCPNILGKNLVSKISAKMFSANQIEEFLNQLYL